MKSFIKAFIKANWRGALAAVLASFAIMNFAEFTMEGFSYIGHGRTYSPDAGKIFYGCLMLFGARALTRNRRAS